MFTTRPEPLFSFEPLFSLFLLTLDVAWLFPVARGVGDVQPFAMACDQLWRHGEWRLKLAGATGAVFRRCWKLQPAKWPADFVVARKGAGGLSHGDLRRRQGVSPACD